jgi:hypothetical protein
VTIEVIVSVEKKPWCMHQSDKGWLYGTTDKGTRLVVGGYDNTGAGYRFTVGDKVRNTLAGRKNDLGEPMESWVSA